MTVEMQWDDRRAGRDRRIGLLDLLLALLLVGFVVFSAYRVSSVMHYQWAWSSIPSYFLRWDPTTHGWVSNLLLDGLLMTIRLSLWGSIIAAVVGLFMGLSQISRNLFLHLVAWSYVALIRNIPPLVFIFIFYFFISSQILPLLDLDGLARDASPAWQRVLWVAVGDPSDFNTFLSGLLALGLFEGAYVTEIVRAGIQSLPKGQWEASQGLGLSRLKTLRLVILPQAFRKVIPPLTGQFISLIKDSAIVSLISVPELSFAGTEMTASTRGLFEVWITIAAIYFVLCFGCSLGFDIVNRRLASTGSRR
jgi:polar amino acid transport system permease protein